MLIQSIQFNLPALRPIFLTNHYRKTRAEVRGLSQSSRLLSSLFLMFALLITACSPAPVKPSSSVLEQPVVRADIKLIERLITVGEFEEARRQLQFIDAERLSNRDSVSYYIATAQIARSLELAETGLQALNALRSYDAMMTPRDDQIATLLKAELHEIKGDYFSAARERDFISSELSLDQQENNHERIWQNLQMIEFAELVKLKRKSPRTQMLGWLELATITRDESLTLNQQLDKLRSWKNRWRSHPAVRQYPGTLTNLADLDNKTFASTNITLALPLSGRLAASGKAIRDGFMAMYYQDVENSRPTPNIMLADSADINNLETLYDAPINNGSDWLVGPLSKDLVETMQQREELPIPTIAMNYSLRDYYKEEQQGPLNLFQFGLAAEDEAIQIAKTAYQKGHRSALVLLPQGSWGKRIEAAFRFHYEALGGKIAEVHFYSTARDYNPAVQALLNVDTSQARSKKIRSMVRDQVEYEPRRRQDADWIFLAALPPQARQINPTLAFNYAGDLPVYATSHVFSGNVDIGRDRDLNNIHFCDVPWLLRRSELFDTISKAANGQGAYARLYAMGVDAYRLVSTVKYLEALPASYIKGSSGDLVLDAQRRIIRRTECSQFKDGAPILLTMQPSSDKTSVPFASAE